MQSDRDSLLSTKFADICENEQGSKFRVEKNGRPVLCPDRRHPFSEDGFALHEYWMKQSCANTDAAHRPQTARHNVQEKAKPTIDVNDLKQVTTWPKMPCTTNPEQSHHISELF